MSMVQTGYFLRAMELIANGEVEDPDPAAVIYNLDDKAAAFHAATLSTQRTLAAARERAEQEHFDAGPRRPHPAALAAAVEAFVDEIFWLHGVRRPKAAGDADA